MRFARRSRRAAFPLVSQAPASRLHGRDAGPRVLQSPGAPRPDRWPGPCLYRRNAGALRTRRSASPARPRKDMETEMTELSQPMLLDGTPPRAVEAPAARTVLHSPSFRQLMAIKRRAVVPLLGASLA